MARCTIARIFSRSGSAVLIIGGTNDTVAIFWLLALSERSTKRSSSLAGRFVESIAEPALVIFSKLRSTVCGLICVEHRVHHALLPGHPRVVVGALAGAGEPERVVAVELLASRARCSR